MMRSLNVKTNFTFNIFIYLLISIYTLACVLVSLHRYWQYDAFYYDLGIFDMAIWKVSRFKAPIIDHLAMGGKWIFADHFVPSIFLFSPLYWITNKTEMLMIVQSLCVGLGLFFGFLIAKKILRHKLIQLALLVSFMGYIGLQNAIISNFHPIVAAILPLMICFWAIINQKWLLYWLSFIILLGFKEDMAIIGFGLGIYIFLRNKKMSKIGVLTSVFSLIYGLLVIKFIIPGFLGKRFGYSPNMDRPLINWITDFFWPPVKIKTLVVSFATFGFLPLFYLPLLPTILGTFYSRFVLVGGPARFGLAMHYSALISPLMFMASVEALKCLEKKMKPFLSYYALIIIFIVLVFHRFIFHGPLGLVYHPEFYKNTPRHKFLNEFVKKVPTDGRVMTQNHLAVRFAHYDVVMLREKYWQYNPKYIVIELRSGQNANNFWPMQDWAVKKMVEKLKKDKNYKLIYNFSEQYIFEKK